MKIQRGAGYVLTSVLGVAIGALVGSFGGMALGGARIEHYRAPKERTYVEFLDSHPQAQQDITLREKIYSGTETIGELEQYAILRQHPDALEARTLRLETMTAGCEETKNFPIWGAVIGGSLGLGVVVLKKIASEYCERGRRLSFPTGQQS